MINPTHIATNKKSSEVVKVKYCADSDEYKVSFMVCIVTSEWDLKKIDQRKDDER